MYGICTMKVRRGVLMTEGWEEGERTFAALRLAILRLWTVVHLGTLFTVTRLDGIMSLALATLVKKIQMSIGNTLLQ